MRHFIVVGIIAAALIISGAFSLRAKADDNIPTREETCFAVLGFASMGLMIDGKTMKGFELVEVQTKLEPKTRPWMRKLVKDGLVQDMDAGNLTKSRLFEMVGHCMEWYGK